MTYQRPTAIMTLLRILSRERFLGSKEKRAINFVTKESFLCLAHRNRQWKRLLLGTTVFVFENFNGKQKLVRGERLELSRVSPHAPQTCAYTNSAIRALLRSNTVVFELRRSLRSHETQKGNYFNIRFLRSQWWFRSKIKSKNDRGFLSGFRCPRLLPHDWPKKIYV